VCVTREVTSINLLVILPRTRSKPIPRQHDLITYERVKVDKLRQYMWPLIIHRGSSVLNVMSMHSTSTL